MTRLIIFAVAVLFGACGPDDDNNGANNGNNGSANNGGNNSNNGVVANNGAPTGDCFLRVDLSGAVMESLEWGLSEGCGGGSGSEENRVAVGFGGITTDLNVKVILTDATKGMVGDALGAEVSVRLVDMDQEWLATDCTVDLTTNEIVDSNEVGDSVLLEGTGSCPSAATAVEPNTAEPVEVGDFQFRSTALW